jgi:hypothetical protein
MTNWEKVKEAMANTIILMIEDIPKADGMETEIDILYPSRLNDLLTDYNDIFDLYDQIREDYHLLLEYHINTDKDLQIWIKSYHPPE